MKLRRLPYASSTFGLSQHRGAILSAAALLANVSAWSTTIIATTGDHGEEGEAFHKPTMDGEFFTDPFLFGGTPFAINRIMMIRIIATIAIVIVFMLYAKRAKLVPGRAQAFVESLLGFVQKGIGEEILGEQRARRYLPVLSMIFVGVLFMNITGIIPGLQIAATSVIGMPLIFALVAYFAFIIAGIKEQGTGPFFKSQLMPAGIPKPIYFILTPIEAFSTFVVRPATLALRLLANMVSGHILLVLCFSATHALFFAASGVFKTLGVVTFAAGAAFVGFELFIAALQAYIFTLLTAVYISLSVEAH